MPDYAWMSGQANQIFSGCAISPANQRGPRIAAKRVTAPSNAWPWPVDEKYPGRWPANRCWRRPSMTLHNTHYAYYGSIPAPRACQHRLDPGRHAARPKPTRSPPLDRQMPPDILAIHLRAVTARDDFAARQHHDLISQLARKVKVLLAQQDADVAAFAQHGNDPADVLDDGRLYALGRLVEDDEPRLGRDRMST